MPDRHEIGNTLRIDMILKDLEASRKPSKRIVLHKKQKTHSKSSLNSDFGKLFHSTYDATLIAKPTGSIEEANLRASEFFQFSDKELRQMNLSELIQGADEELMQRISSSLDDHPYTLIRAYCIRKDGSLFPAEIAISQLVLKEQLFSLFIRDITKRLQLETELAHSRKMQSVGQLAAGIAHEINTPIQFIGDNLTFLRDSFSDAWSVLDMYREFIAKVRTSTATEDDIAKLDARLKEFEADYLEDEIPKTIIQSLEGIGRISSIVKAMRTLSYRNSSGLPVETNINGLLEDTVTVSRNEWKYTADVHLELDPQLRTITCLPDELAQVFLNLIVNAAQAIKSTVGESGDKGSITVSSATKGSMVEIRISDTGPGIPPEIQDRIFEPFFTTKEVGVGSGQGLAIAHNVVIGKHGGELFFETAPGAGTTFIVRLPLTIPAANK